MRDFGDEAVSTEQLQLARYSRRPAPLAGGIAGRGVEIADDVGIAEAVKTMLALQDSAEQALFVVSEEVETAAASLVEVHGLAGSIELPPGRVGPIDDGQGIEVTLVGGAGDGVVVVEIGDALVHGAPDHLSASLANAESADFELTRLVDDGLDAEDEAEFVVHLQPVVFDPMLDASAGESVFLAIGEDFAVEAGMQPSTEEGEDVLSGELESGVIEQARIKMGEVVAGTEQEIGAVFGLIDDPVVAA